MSKKTFFIILIGLIVITGGGLYFSEGKNNPGPENQGGQIILYYGEGCRHCAKVEEFIKENKIDEKVVFERKEVYSNKENANELREKAQKCGLATTSIGVPFLWDGFRCIIGDIDIIDFFKEKANVQ